MISYYCLPNGPCGSGFTLNLSRPLVKLPAKFTFSHREPLLWHSQFQLPNEACLIKLSEVVV